MDCKTFLQWGSLPAELSSVTGARVSRLQSLQPCVNRFRRKKYYGKQYSSGWLDQRCLVTKKQRLAIHSCTKTHTVGFNAGAADINSRYREHALELHPSTSSTILHTLDVLYRFSRLYAAIGKVLIVVSASFLTAESLLDFTPSFFIKTFEAVVSAFLMVIYIGGYNQITDIEIDKSFLLAWKSGSSPFFWATFSAFALGTAYSLDMPLLRWKKHPLMSAFCSVCDQALVVPLAFIVHAQTHIHGRPAHLSRPIIFAMIVRTIFTIAMTFFKDIPDIEGDQRHGIKSLACRLGAKKMFWTCVWFMEIAYGVAIFMGLSSPFIWSKFSAVWAHLLMASILWTNAKSVDLGNKSDIQSFYMFTWMLFYVESLLMLLVR